MATLDTSKYMTPEDHAIMIRKGPSGLPIWSFDRRTGMVLNDRSDARYIEHVRKAADMHGVSLHRELCERIEWFANTEDGENLVEAIPY